jgi:hypothetical protein
MSCLGGSASRVDSDVALDDVRQAEPAVQCVPRQEPGNEKAGAWEREGRSLGTRRQEPGNEKAGAWEREGRSLGTRAGAWERVS